MPFNLGLPELLIVLVVVIIVFGVGRLPEIGGALGKGIKEFRRSQKDLDEETRSRAESKAEKKNESS